MAFVLDDQNLDQDNETSMGSDASESEMATSFVSSVTASIGKVTVKIRKDGSPTDNVFIKIYSDNSGVPNTQVGGNSDTVAGSSLSASLADQDFTWSSNVPSLTATVKYWIAICRQTPANPNFYRLGIGTPLYRNNYQKFTPWADPGNNFSMYFLEYYDSGVVASSRNLTLLGVGS